MWNGQTPKIFQGIISFAGLTTYLRWSLVVLAALNVQTSGTVPFTDENFNLEQLMDEEFGAFQKLFHKAMRSMKPPGDGTIQ